jgi:serine protease
MQRKFTMNTVQQSIRGFLSLALFGGLLGMLPSAHAQQFTVSPATPEVYQPFTITLSIFCQRTINVDPHVGSGAITIEAKTNTIDFLCPGDLIEAPPATIAGLPGGTHSLAARLRTNFDPPQEHALGDITVAPAPPTQPIFAFYNDAIGHYFITAGTAERDSLLGGGGGGGWAMVDEGFKAWPADGPAPAAAKPVCRFYSSLVNSHFYTAGINECELLKQSGSGWTYEGIAFRALVPTKGSCYPGTTPVWRLYNDRFAQADSNHRFVASADTYRHMIGNGWVGEGVAFCSPES